MMKTLAIGFALIAFTLSSFGQSSRVVLSDSLPFEDMITSGSATILRIGGRIADTIDASFGVHAVGESNLLYQKVEISSYSENSHSYQGTYSDYILYHQGKRSPLRKYLRYFDDWFSSPTIIQGRLFYWGLRRMKGLDSLSIYAMRYDFSQRKLVSCLLFTDVLETDNPGFFYQPQQDKKGFLFQYEYGRWFLDTTFTQKKFLKD